MSEVLMPRLSDTMEEGVISTWNFAVGDKVKPGDVLVDIETDKAVMEYEAYEAGVLESILVEPGQTVPIGAPIAVINTGAPASPAPAAPPVPVAAVPAPVAESVPAGTAESEGVRVARPPSSPLARKLAREHGVDLTTLAGSGPGGRVVRADVEAAASRTPTGVPAGPAVPTRTGTGARAAGALDGTAGVNARTAGADASAGSVGGAGAGSVGGASAGSVGGAGAGGLGGASAGSRGGAGAVGASGAGSAGGSEVEADERVPLSRFRRVAAKRLTESMRETPHFYLTRTAGVGALLALRAELNKTLAPAKVSVNDLVVKACAKALREHPELNVSFTEDALILHRKVHVGVAVAVAEGLVVPVIRDADAKGVAQIGAETRELAGKARDGKLKPQEMSGSTFSVSNLGMFGVESFTAVINPPEAAILAVGAVRREPVVSGDEIVVADRMTVTLSVDHRAADGATGAVFLGRVIELLENPLAILA